MVVLISLVVLVALVVMVILSQCNIMKSDHECLPVVQDSYKYLCTIATTGQ